MVERLFTIESAHSEIERLRPMVERMTRVYRELCRHPASCPTPEGRVERHYFQLLVGLQAVVDRIEGSGVQVADRESGMLDFPAVRDGRAVLLCWRLGEPAVCFWHERGEGLDERRPVHE